MSYSRGLAAVPLPTTGKAADPALIAAIRAGAAPTIAAAPVTVTAPGVDPWAFVTSQCVDYRYAAVGAVPDPLPPGSVLVFVVPGAHSPTGRISWSDVPNPLLPGGYFTFLRTGTTLVQGGANAGVAAWVAIRTTQQYAGDARRGLLQTCTAYVTAAARNARWSSLLASTPFVLAGLAPGASDADIQVGVMNAVGAIGELGTAFASILAAVHMEEAVKRPLRLFTGNASLLVDGIDWLSRGPALAASAPLQARQTVDIANRQISSTPDQAAIDAYANGAVAVLDALRNQLSSGIRVLQAAAAATLPSPSELAGAIAAMRTSAVASLVTANAWLRDVSPALRQYFECQGQKNAESEVRTEIANARAASDYIEANRGAQASMPAVAAQLQAALDQVNVIAGDLNLPWYKKKRNLLWIGLGVVGVLGTAVTARVIRSRHRKADAVTANRRRRLRG